MGKEGVGSDRDDGISPGPVHRSQARELGVMLWGLAIVTIIVVGRYATVGAVQAPIQESWLVLLQVVVVLAVFAVMSPILAAYLSGTGFSR